MLGNTVVDCSWVTGWEEGEEGRLEGETGCPAGNRFSAIGDPQNCCCSTSIFYLGRKL